MLPGIDCDATLAHSLPIRPVAAVRNRERAGDVGPVQEDMERAAIRRVGDARVEIVRASADIDGVLHPFAGLGVADVITAAGVGGGFDVNAVVGAECAAEVLRFGVVVSHAFATLIEVLGLHHDQSAKRRRRRWGRG